MNKKIIYIALIFTIPSCEKSNSPDVETFSDKVEFFSNTPNLSDGLVAKTQMSTPNSIIYFYGGFNAKGLQNSINSILLEQKDSDFYCNYIFDTLSRPILIYTTKRNGTNENVILKLSYPSSDSVVYSLYNYDWVLKTDSLLQENRISKITGGNTIVYGRVDATEPDLDAVEQEYQDLEDQWKTSLTNGLIKVKVLSGFNRLSAIWTNTITSAVINAAIIDAGLTNTLFSIKEKIAKARASNTVSINSYEETYGINTIPPQSPSGRFIPNPSGTPSYPKGYSQIIIGNWKQTSNRVCGTELYSLPPGQSFVCNGTGLFFAPLNCQRDDILIFNTNKSIIYSEGALSCSPPSIGTGTYSLNGDFLSFNISNNSGISNAYIALLNATTMKLGLTNQVLTYQRQ